MKITCGLGVAIYEKLRTEVVNCVYDLILDYSYTNPGRDVLAEAQIVAIAELYMKLQNLRILPESASNLSDKMVIVCNTCVLEWMESFSPKTGWMIYQYSCIEEDSNIT